MCACTLKLLSTVNLCKHVVMYSLQELGLKYSSPTSGMRLRQQSCLVRIHGIDLMDFCEVHIANNMNNI
jgi:hypothetical protein